MKETSVAEECLRSLILMSQFGLSIAVPLVLCTYGAYWLQNRFALGGWVVIAGLLIGLLGAIGGVWRSYRLIQRSSKGKKS